ncbi:Disulfide bond formation protein DsbB [Poseidonocella pacifica]|uniref:Disulfide bond formation protein DsbB n=1 Tax=Poseidonocella pacifica TaxID=871651 RepID=A0A1I0VBR0_9RHOB|nr:disulfide bond formation protein B [Poseidonocella pacifica]SFA73775.1 Disulfide bond formation protein DsbB [Poseidonocella pacifica]
MNRRLLVILAAGGSAALLLGAFAFQHLGGLAPCKMCLWQRWPHAAAILIGAVAVVVPGAALPLLGALAAAATAAIGIYHAGVEWDFWEGPTSCTATNNIGGLSPTELLAQIQNAPIVRCDDIAWSLAGLSMAGWNAVLSLVLVGIWITAARRA